MKIAKEAFLEILKAPEKSKLWQRTDLEGWKILMDKVGYYKISEKTSVEVDLFFLHLEEMSQQGGECDICGKAWKKVETIIFKGKKNETTFFHYEPHCKCYPRCVWCWRWLILERKNKMGGCYYCGKDGIKCLQVRPVMKKNEDGSTQPTKKMQKCKGRLKLQKVTDDGYTLMKCDVCGYEMRKEILI